MPSPTYPRHLQPVAAIRPAHLAACAALAVTTLGLPTADAAPAENRALLDTLVHKGLLTRAEADAVSSETDSSATTRSAAIPITVATASTTRLTLGARLQTQFVALDSDLSGAADLASTQHFLLRRLCVTATADFAPDWRALIIYNFAANTFDAAVIEWKQPDFTAGFGHRMVNLGREQRTSNGVLKAIERSAPTRYFTECQSNGTRLGAGSYRVGAFIDGTHDHLFWGAAVTNPEQASTLALTSGTGNGRTNTPALWLNGGVNLPVADGGTLTLGTGLGWVPGQGGTLADPGHDLAVGSVFADLSAGRFSLLAELFAASNERGAAATATDATPWGAYVQPAWKFTPTVEAVLRISYLDTDGGGATLADAVPGAPSPAGATFDRVTETYLGGNWYLHGNDVKVQAGLVHARATDALSGPASSATTTGLRSQLQVNF